MHSVYVVMQGICEIIQKSKQQFITEDLKNEYCTRRQNISHLAVIVQQVNSNSKVNIKRMNECTMRQNIGHLAVIGK